MYTIFFKHAYRFECKLETIPLRADVRIEIGQNRLDKNREIWLFFGAGIYGYFPGSYLSL